LEKYIAQINIPEIGLLGQKAMGNAKVLVIGAGGLGCPVLLYLTSAGIGTIGIVDNDIVSIGNLHRQIIYGEGDVGRYKVDVASEKLHRLNPDVKILTFKERFRDNNSTIIFQDFDLIIDCSDNHETRILIDKVSAELNKPWIYAAVGGFEGMISVFNYKNGIRYKDLYFNNRESLSPTSCTDYGILGSTCAHAASIEVTEAIKIILGLTSVLDGSVLTFDLLSYKVRMLKISVASKNTTIKANE
jgi:molybdopterin/thiamine biosynthesis adenylyltransferase